LAKSEKGKKSIMGLQGKTIGQYQLIELVHQGQNTIYKGFQPSMKRQVAVKTFSPSLAKAEAFIQQFEWEMELIVELEHAHILHVYDYGQVDDLLYTVTPYVEGGTLQDRLPPGLSPQATRAMIDPISAALDYAHTWGVVHGNLKPSNVLFDSHGQPLLADMGAFHNARFAARNNAYISPEQEAQGAAVDGRTDVYALGVLLYEMLVGEPPSVGADPSLGLIRPDLPVGIETVIRRAVAPYPEDRFPWAGDLNDALARVLTSRAEPRATSAFVRGMVMS
jgi:serine/threonine-protein kinase PpkA